MQPPELPRNHPRKSTHQQPCTFVSIYSNTNSAYCAPWPHIPSVPTLSTQIQQNSAPGASQCTTH